MFLCVLACQLGRAKHSVNNLAAQGWKVPWGYTFECQYAKAINTAWNGSLPQANTGDIFIATPLV